jgi:predicted HicB family RNase H-like nuclease
MKTPKANRDDVRESTFTATVTKAEKKAIQEMANKSGLTLSAWVRMVLAEKINQK